MSGVEIRVRSNSTQAQNDLKRLERSVAGIEKGVANATKAFRTMAIGITSVFAAGGAVKGINGTTDALTDMQNRVALVTGRGKELTKTMDSIYRISKQTRGSVDGSTEVFNRFGIALKGTGRSAEEVLKAVESVNKAVAISGTGGESAKAALIQLGQGLASGQLRGQELNSVLEQAPRLAQVIADEMEIPLGKLREVAAEGQITSDIVFEGLLNQAEKLSEEFSGMEATSTQAFGILRDQAGRVTAEISKQLGITETFTARANRMSDYLEKNRTRIVASVTGTATSIGKFFDTITNSIKGIANIVGTIVKELLNLADFGAKPIEIVNMSVLGGAVEGLKKVTDFLKNAKDDASFVKKYVEGITKSTKRMVGGLDSLKTDAIVMFARWSKIASDNMAELYEKGKLWAALKYVEFRGGSGIIADYKMYLKVLDVQNKAEKSVKSLFNTTKELASSATAKAWRAIKSFLDAVERKFYWAYDEIIQNSWWTDTMEQTYFLAKEWLGRAGDVVSTFANNVHDKFKGIYDRFNAKGNFSLKLDVTELNIDGITANLMGMASTVGKNLADTFDSVFEVIVAKSPATGALIGASMVAGITRFVSPKFFAATFAKAGPLAALALASAVLKPLISTLADSDAFFAVGTTLGQTLGLGLSSIVGSLPQLIKALLNGLSGVGAGLGKHLGEILGTQFKFAFNLIPFGDLLLGALSTVAIGAVLSKNIRKVVVTSLASIGSLGTAGGVMSTLFFGPNATRTERIVAARGERMSQTALASLTKSARKARLIHMGTMTGGYLLASSLLGTILPQEMVAGFSTAAALITPVLTNMFLDTPGTGRFIKRMFGPVKEALANLGPLVIASFGKLRLALLDVNKLGLKNAIVARLHTKAWVTGNASVAASFTGVIAKMSKMGKVAGIGVLALGLLSTAAFASADGVGDASASMVNSLLSVSVAASLIAPMFAGTAIATAVKGGLIAAFKGVGNILLRFFVTPIITAIGAAVSAVFALPIAIAGAITTIVATVGGFSIYSLFFGEGDSFIDRVKNNFNGLIKAIFGVKKQTKIFRKEIDQIARSVEGNLKNLDIEIDIVANIKRADLRNLSGKDQDKLVAELRKLEQLQAQAIREESLFGSVSTELLDKIEKSTASIDKKTAQAGKIDINEASASRVDTTILQILSATSRLTSLRGTDVGKEIAEYLRDEKINTDNPEGRVAIAETMTGFINQAISSGAISDTGALSSFLPLFEEIMLRNGDLGTKTIDALDGFKAFTRLSLSAGRMNGFSGNIQDAIQESLNEVRLERVKEERAGLLKMVEDAGKQFSLSLPDSLKFLGTEQLRELANYIRPVNAAANAADPTFEAGRSPFRQNEILLGGAMQSEIDAVNRTVLDAQLAIDKMDRSLQTVNKGIDITNAKLSELGLPEIDVSGAFNTMDNLDGVTQAIDKSMNSIQDTTDEIAANAANTELTDEQRFKTNQKLAEVLDTQKNNLAKYVRFANQVGIADSERLGLLSTAVGTLDNYSFDMNKLLGVDAETLKGITDAQNKVATMTLLLQEMAASSSDSVRGFSKEAATSALEDAQKRVTDLLKGTGVGKFTGAIGKTAMEKFIGGLEDTGFESDMALVGTLSQKQINNMANSLKAIDEANKKINKSALSEVGIREKALAVIEKQRDAIAESLASGTVRQAQASFEGLGMDPEAINYGEDAIAIQQRLAELQREKLALNANDHEGILVVNNAIEKQERLYAAMTEQRNSLNEAFRSSLKSNLSDVLKGAKTLSEGIHGVLDSLSNAIIDTVVGSFADALIESAGLKDMFGSLFDGLFGGGSSLGEKVSSGIRDSISKGMLDAKETGGFTSFFSSLTSGFTGLLGNLGSGLSSIFSSIGGMFGGMFGGGGGLGGLLSSGMSFFGFSNGGIVPHISGARAGMDSVPAMLTPGELVVPANSIDDFLKGNTGGGSTQQFNINIQGDVSRQTRAEIVKMMPQIAGGVNAQNKESNYRQ